MLSTRQDYLPAGAPSEVASPLPLGLLQASSLSAMLEKRTDTTVVQVMVPRASTLQEKQAQP
jgi:hypothetical protein